MTRNVGIVLLLAVFVGCGTRNAPAPPDAPTPPPTAALTSADCKSCHARQHETWHRTYHRTMTRDAAPDTVKGDFPATHHYQGLRTRLTRQGDSFFMETIDPDWAAQRASAVDPTRVPPPQFARFRVDRLVGSHWLQECLHRTPDGKFIRLPVLYHIGEKRWVHSNGAFLAPDTPDFWSQSRGATWNESCLYCHNTGPSKNPTRGANGHVTGYETTVDELGISCAACHGPGTEHVKSGGAGEDVVHPSRLPVPRRDEICARCHGALVPKVEAWDRVTHRDPFVPGQELAKFNWFFKSEAEQDALARTGKPPPVPLKPEPNDGRFWGDGTPLTTALEFNGLSLSACYQNGGGKLSCLTCHTMHGDEPDMMLKPNMRTNDACYQCHSDYRTKLADHTKHAAGSAGSLCYSCHMPHTVYSLMTTHRSHRIETPTLAGSVGTGKPHACNLCHLDKSLGWTRDQLARWPGQAKLPPTKLTEDEEKVSAAVLLLSRGDARTRAIVAGAFSDSAAREAAGTDWTGSMLSRVLEHERYPAVRYLAHRGLKLSHGELANPFDHVGTPAQRLEELRSMRSRLDALPVRRPLAFLPLTAKGLPDDAILERLRKNRHDPNLMIHE